MGWFGKKKPVPMDYDPAVKQPAIRRSICTGEMTAGFIERDTGKFQELMLLRDREEAADFAESVGKRLNEIKTVY